MSWTLTYEGTIPFSITTLRNHCRINNDSFDVSLTSAYYAAVADIEKRANILLRESTVRGTVQGSPNGYRFPLTPVNLDSITVTNDETGAVAVQGRTGDYIVSHDLQNPTLQVMDASKFDVDVVYNIGFTAGYESVPSDIEVGVLELTAHHFENRESTSPFPLHNVPSSVWSILANHGRASI